MQAFVVEEMATGRDHPRRQALHVQRVHTDHALNPSISCLDIPLLPARGQTFVTGWDAYDDSWHAVLSAINARLTSDDVIQKLIVGTL